MTGDAFEQAPAACERQPTDGTPLNPPVQMALRALDYQSPPPVEYAPVDLSFPGWLYIFRTFGIIALIFLFVFACFAITIAMFD